MTNFNSTMEKIEGDLRILVFMDQPQQLHRLREQLTKCCDNQGDRKWKWITSVSLFARKISFIRSVKFPPHSSEYYAAKHPILLPISLLTDLVITERNLSVHHSAHALLLIKLRQLFGPIGEHTATMKVYLQCHSYFCANPQSLQQLVADLFSCKFYLKGTVTRTPHPVQETGVGLAMYQPSPPRGASHKQLCLPNTVHLEFATNLSTEALFANFRFFTARRTTPRHIYSNCVKNFVGAAREFAVFLQQEDFQQDITTEASQHGVIWHLNPPIAAHHGGLWEAWVNSHLHRIAQHISLPFEEICAMLCQIEAIIHRHSIGIMFHNASEPSCFIPVHFTRKMPGRALPDPDLRHIQKNRLWQVCLQDFQEFGKKFRLFYLDTLLQRSQEGMYTCPITRIARLPTKEFNSLRSETSDDPPEHPGEHVQHPL
ncbi:uncharacterized protein LOC129786773 [Lutzomyia longipalpis]|uniref:uncharacterized protein LOC129786773 n=1 Tax=Lutzomyia longipalpis TaxID=7200 RepID=UPI0024839BE5|nr:uncharacterized protein LOC129786773 [Lutzomyia longipalpis]